MFVKGGLCMAKSNAQIGLRLAGGLKERIERQAKKERRSVSSLIIKVMEEYLESREDEE